VHYAGNFLNNWGKIIFFRLCFIRLASKKIAHMYTTIACPRFLRVDIRPNRQECNFVWPQIKASLHRQLHVCVPHWRTVRWSFRFPQGRRVFIVTASIEKTFPSYQNLFYFHQQMHCIFT
jgi:hypothetical protein